MFTILGFIAGCFVGWSFPQPQWVKNVVNAIKAKFNGDKTGSPY